MVAIWGAGQSAEVAVDVLGLQVDRVFDSYATGERFGRPIEPAASIDSSIDELLICSMYYVEMLEQALAAGLDADRIRILHAHRVHPAYLLNEVPVDVALTHRGEYSTLVRDESTPGAERVTDRLDHLTTAFQATRTEGLALEFGVFRGETFFHLNALSAAPVWGFDSNLGFTEDAEGWQGLIHHGYTPIPVELATSPSFIEGWFEDTLPTFLDQYRDPIAFVHYDAASIDACRFVLSSIEERLRVGTVLVFDEMLVCADERTPDAPEWVAWHELTERRGLGFEWIGRSGAAASVRVTRVAGERA